MLVHLFNSSIVSGPETLVIPALSKLDQKVIVIFLVEARRAEESKAPVAFATEHGLETRTIVVRSRIDRRAISELSEHLCAMKPAIVHAHDVKASTYLLQATKLIKDRTFKIVSTNHGVRGRPGLKIKLYGWYYVHFVLPHFDRVLAVCSSDGALLVKSGLEESKVRVHLNGVDRLEVTLADSAAARLQIHKNWELEKFGVSSDSVIVGFVGRIAPEKRIDRILVIVKELSESSLKLPNWRVIFFGRGPLLDSFKKQAHALGISNLVHWYGYRAGLGDELAGIDILISLSDAEGLPINLIEAGWAGVPVLATAVDGNLDLMPSPEFGALVPIETDGIGIAQELGRLIENSALRRKIGAKFQERVKKYFSGECWIRKLRQIYSELL